MVEKMEMTISFRVMNFDVLVVLRFSIRKLFQTWCERAESANKLSSQAVSYTFHDIDIFPSSSQIHEMLHCANECSKRQNGDYLTFGEFCVYASELQTCYNKKIPRPIPLSRCPRERKLNVRRRSNAVQNSTPNKYEVFLGGSCNPTSWRTDVAIPLLKDMDITYYNPQVAVWGPELIELENMAKQNAEVMFFVIDNQTRSVASMIEASHVAGTQRKLVLVVHEFDKPGAIVMGEKITEIEFDVLQRGHRYLRDIVERQGLPVFSNIPQALKSASTILTKNIRPQDLTIQDATHPVKMAHLQIGDKLIKLREVFDDLDALNSGEISLRDVCMAFKIITSTELPVDNLKAIIANKQGFQLGDDNLEASHLDKIKVNFDHFCCIMTEFRGQSCGLPQNLESLRSKATHLLCSALSPLSKLLSWTRPVESEVAVANANEFSFAAEYRNIYLGGTPKPSTWRQDIAIPLLKKKGLTYFVPQEGVWCEHLIPLEAANMENSQVLLFVITKDSRSLAPMIVAAHYVGLGCQVVLCLQYIPEDTEICGEKLSSQAVKDYNRGRVYLSDLATRSGVPVFEDIGEAVECAMNLSLAQTPI